MSRYLLFRYRKIFAAMLLSAMIVIYILALLPQAQAPQFSWSDKANHVFAFVTLALLLRLGFSISYPKALALLIGYGIFIELSQYFTTTRSAEWADVGADAVGSFIGLSIYRYLRRIFG